MYALISFGSLQQIRKCLLVVHTFAKHITVTENEYIWTSGIIALSGPARTVTINRDLYGKILPGCCWPLSSLIRMFEFSSVGCITKYVIVSEKARRIRTFRKFIANLLGRS